MIDVANDPNFLAQDAHAGWGAALTLILTPHTGHWQAALYVTEHSAAKEAIESLWGVWEPKQPWSSGGVDFTFWLPGIMLSWVRPDADRVLRPSSLIPRLAGNKSRPTTR